MSVSVNSTRLFSPSADRRKALKKAADETSSKFQILASCPLSKYMDVADRLLEHFCAAADEERLDEAYVFGLRFANLCLSGLPQHPEWKSSATAPQAPSGDKTATSSTITSKRGTTNSATNTADRKARLTSTTAFVLRKMAVVKQQMDADEIAKLAVATYQKEQEEIQRLEAEERRKRKQEEERVRERQICDALDQKRAQFRASQRRLLV